MATKSDSRREAAAGSRAPAGLDAGLAPDVGAADAASLIARLGGALAEIARTLDRLGTGLGPALAAAAERDPSLLVEAQALDAASQSLHGLTAFLAEVGRCRVGREPLHLDVLAASLPLEALAGRLSGATAEAARDDVVFF